jgi:SAM-dependent methyltransferase
MAKVRQFLARDGRVLDIGCADGALFRQFGHQMREFVGIDSTLERSIEAGRCRLLAGHFPDDLPDCEPFDTITMLAVLEHVPSGQQPRCAVACTRILKPGGYLIVTTPYPVVDRILVLLKQLRLLDGMSLEEHYGFQPRNVRPLFSSAGLELVTSRRFQLGCNNLFVFRKPSTLIADSDATARTDAGSSMAAGLIGPGRWRQESAE